MKLKYKPNDFRVRELLKDDYLTEKGAHNVYHVTKRKLTSIEAAEVLAELANIPVGEIAMAGLKDRQGVTEQFMSFSGGKRVELNTPELKLTPIGSAETALSSENSYGNAFEIRLRELDPVEYRRLSLHKDVVGRLGVPNYFDEQRFGNLKHGQGWIAKDLMLGKHEQALRSLLCAESDFDSGRHGAFKHQLREAWGDWSTCRDIAGKFGEHHSVFDHLRKEPTDFAGAFFHISSRLRLIHLYAFQSHIWNRAVASYFASISEDGGARIAETLEGPQVYPDRKLAVDLEWGGSFRLPGEGLEDVEHANQRELLVEALAAEGLTPEQFRISGVSGFQLKGEDRRLFIRPRHLKIENGKSRDGAEGTARLTFELPRGAYATLVIRGLLARFRKGRIDLANLDLEDWPDRGPRRNAGHSGGHARMHREGGGDRRWGQRGGQGGGERRGSWHGRDGDGQQQESGRGREQGSRWQGRGGEDRNRSYGRSGGGGYQGGGGDSRGQSYGRSGGGGYQGGGGDSRGQGHGRSGGGYQGRGGDNGGQSYGRSGGGGYQGRGGDNGGQSYGRSGGGGYQGRGGDNGGQSYGRSGGGGYQGRGGDNRGQGHGRSGGGGYQGRSDDNRGQGHGRSGGGGYQGRSDDNRGQGHGRSGGGGYQGRSDDNRGQGHGRSGGGGYQGRSDDNRGQGHGRSGGGGYQGRGGDNRGQSHGRSGGGGYQGRGGDNRGQSYGRSGGGGYQGRSDDNRGQGHGRSGGGGYQGRSDDNRGQGHGRSGGGGYQGRGGDNRGQSYGRSGGGGYQGRSDDNRGQSYGRSGGGGYQGRSDDNRGQSYGRSGGGGYQGRGGDNRGQNYGRSGGGGYQGRGGDNRGQGYGRSGGGGYQGRGGDNRGQSYGRSGGGGHQGRDGDSRGSGYGRGGSERGDQEVRSKKWESANTPPPSYKGGAEPGNRGKAGSHRSEGQDGPEKP